jgi:hypothetical protein
MFAEFEGCEATVLAYFNAPHRTAIIAVRGPSREEDAFLVLHGCRRLELPVSWKVSSISAVRKDDSAMILADPESNVYVDFYGGRLLGRDAMLAFFGGDVGLIQQIVNFHST